MNKDLIIGLMNTWTNQQLFYAYLTLPLESPPIFNSGNNDTDIYRYIIERLKSAYENMHDHKMALNTFSQSIFNLLGIGYDEIYEGD